MDSHLVSERVERMAWIDAVAIPLQRFVNGAYDALGEPGKALRRMLHGDFMGHPLHPVTVHLPIGAWLLAALLDPWGGSLAARMGADLAVAVGVVAALGSALTGATDYAAYTDVPTRRIGGLHAILNWTAVALYALSWIGRHEGARDLARVLSYGGFGAVGLSGYLGGLMVYERRIGTNHAPLPEETPDAWTTVARLADLPQNTPFRAETEALTLVLVRQGDLVDAFADSCSHQGGSLSEGRVVDDCLECPLHHTCFRLSDGEPVSGPGVFAQPRYPVRIENGMVLVETRPLERTEFETPAGKASMM